MFIEQQHTNICARRSEMKQELHQKAVYSLLLICHVNLVFKLCFKSFIVDDIS
jgi:hypothetical protein